MDINFLSDYFVLVLFYFLSQDGLEFTILPKLNEKSPWSFCLSLPWVGISRMSQKKNRQFQILCICNNDSQANFVKRKILYHRKNLSWDIKLSYNLLSLFRHPLLYLVSSCLCGSKPSELSLCPLDGVFVLPLAAVAPNTHFFQLCPWW